MSIAVNVSRFAGKGVLAGKHGISYGKARQFAYEAKAEEVSQKCEMITGTELQ